MAIAIENLSIATPLNSSSGGTTAAITTNVTCAAGSTIAVLVYADSGMSSIADNSGNGYVWSIDKTQANSPVICLSSIYASSGLASGTVITMTFTGTASERQMAGISWTGGASASRVDQTNSNTAFGSGAPWATASITPTVSDSIVFGAFGDFGTPGAITSDPTAPWLEWIDLDNGSNFNVTSVYQIVSNTSPRQPAGTFSTSMIGDEAGVTVNYKQGTAVVTGVQIAAAGHGTGMGYW